MLHASMRPARIHRRQTLFRDRRAGHEAVLSPEAAGIPRGRQLGVFSRSGWCSARVNAKQRVFALGRLVQRPAFGRLLAPLQ